MADRPNVLFLMTDHTSARAIAPGSQCIKPGLDSLAAEGVRFERCYTTNAICSPSRASLMTGVYPSTHGMWDCTHTQRAEWVDVPANRFTYFSMPMADAGYRSGYFGKWHVEQSNRLEDFGWHEYDLECQSMLASERGKADGLARIARSEYVESSAVYVPKEGYRDFLLAAVGDGIDDRSHPAFDKAIDFIQRHATSDQSSRPFFCFVSASEPHDPYIPPRKFFDMYDLDTIQLSATLRDEPTGKPEIIKRMRSEWTSLTDDDWRRVTAAYWAVITFVDSEISRIINVLKDIGQYDNTIIVFTSDHGDMLGGHGLVAKGGGTSYEEVYNIPLIIRTPETMKGREDRNTLASLIDLGPTLLDLCGVDPLEGAHGRSLRPVIDGTANPDEWREAYGEFFGQRFVYTQRIVWHGDWKYVFSPGGIDELYDLANDSDERSNLADDPAHRDRLIEMTKRMWRKMKVIGDDSLFNSQYATLRTAPIGPRSVEGP
jgi:arylsulfatase A-like enzyme